MKQIELLEQELRILEENIQRIRDYKNEWENSKFKPYNSRVVGEFRHRIISLKQRLTLVAKITTSDLFSK